jgi:hypothetical protein
MIRLVLISLLLTGCATQFTNSKMPDLPDAFSHSCKNLIPLHENAKLSDLMRTVNTNYARHHECAEQVDAFIEWYDKQKEIRK